MMDNTNEMQIIFDSRPVNDRRHKKGHGTTFYDQTG